MRASDSDYSSCSCRRSSDPNTCSSATGNPTIFARFGPDLHFDCPVSAIAVPNEVLARPVATSNAAFRGIAVQYVREHLGDAHDNRVRRVALLARQLLPTGRCTLATVSEILGAHPRSLQRELRERKSDFRSILDEVRRGLVTDYLRDTNASLGQIAAMLGYADQAAFTNAFQRWFKMPPGRWRAQERAEDRPALTGRMQEEDTLPR